MASDFISNGWSNHEENGIMDSGFLEFMQVQGSNGIVIDGVIAWIDLHLDVHAFDLWMVQTLASFNDEEVQSAKEALWRACEKNIGDTIPKRQGNNKKKADIDDIVKALRKLQSANMMPLVLSNGKMLMRTPMSAGIARNHENNDISNRVSLLENSLNSFMKQ